MPLSAEDFARLWNASKTMGEFCRTTGLRPKPSTVRASRYRKRGVALRFHLGGRKKTDWEKVKQAAQEGAQGASP